MECGFPGISMCGKAEEQRGYFGPARRITGLRPEPHTQQFCPANLCAVTEAYGHKFRYPWLLHRDAIENRRNAHRFLAVCNEHELGLNAHLLYQFGEAADVGFIQRRIDLVENTERARLELEDAN